MSRPAPLPITLYTDNSACRDICDKEGVAGRTRHFDRWLYYCREMRVAGVIRMALIGTKMQIADIFTKALDKTTFQNLRGKLLG